MKVLESFVPKSLQDEVEDYINSGNFQWTFFDNIAMDYGSKPMVFKNPNIVNPIGLVNTIIDNGQIVSGHYSVFRPILLFLEYHENISIKQVLRVRVRRTLRDKSAPVTRYNPPHVDLNRAEPYKSLIYYVSDSDGDSVFFNERFNPETDFEGELKDTNVTECFRYPPKKGHGILFDGHQYHSGNSPIDNLHRTIINFDFIV